MFGLAIGVTSRKSKGVKVISVGALVLKITACFEFSASKFEIVEDKSAIGA